MSEPLGNGMPRSKIKYMSLLTARVILGQVLSIVTCGSQTHIEVTAFDCMPKLLTTNHPHGIGHTYIFSGLFSMLSS